MVTEFEFMLQPLTAVYGGMISYAQAQVADAVRLFRDVMDRRAGRADADVYLGQGGR